VTALRDGMNLVAKEYVASRFDNDGVLVLSEFTGAADELKQAVQINPHDISGLKDAIESAARMPRAERTRRMRALRRRVLENDVSRWSASFLDALSEHAAGQQLDVHPAARGQEAPLGQEAEHHEDGVRGRAAEDAHHQDARRDEAEASR
jgi:trehalose 6-phosphate synthase